MAKTPEPVGTVTAEIIVAVFGAVFAAIFRKALPEHLPLPLGIFVPFLMLMAVFTFQRYRIILNGAGEPPDSEERKEYDAFRQRLLEGGTPAIVYNRWLNIGLGKADHFFGDAGRKDKSWIARAMHLETDGPRWTAEAFDKCLLLALLYPVVTVFAIWAVSGHVGVAERALRLPPDDPAHPYYAAVRRALSFAAVSFAAYAFYRSARAVREHNLYKAVLWVIAAGLGALAAAVAAAGLGALAGAGAGAVAAAGAAAGAAAVAFAAVAAVAAAGLGALAAAVAAAGLGALAGAGAGAAAAAAAGAAKRKGRLGLFLSLFLVAALIACLAAPYWLAPLKTWQKAGALLLFYGVLTLVNAPADWLAIGFTRPLLRRGLSDGGWRPFVYALVDVIVAAILILILAFAMVFAVQTFDDFAVLRAGKDARILPLGPLFDGLESRPGDYEYWWVWVLLFSSMIPSLINLSIAAAAFLRGLPCLNTRILSRMPEDKAMGQRAQREVAAWLTLQVTGGAALTGIAVYLVWLYLIPLGLPAFGAVVRGSAEYLAALNAPARVIIWLAGGR